MAAAEADLAKEKAELKEVLKELAEAEKHFISCGIALKEAELRAKLSEEGTQRRAAAKQAAVEAAAKAGVGAHGFRAPRPKGGWSPWVPRSSSAW